MPSVSDFEHLDELVDWLYQRRIGLSWVCGVLLLCTLGMDLLGPAATVSELHGQQSAADFISIPKFFLLVFALATQALLLWGGGRIVHKRRSWLRVILPALATVLILIFSAGRGFGNLVIGDLELEPTKDWMLYVLAVVMLACVLPAAIIKSRRSDHYRTLVFLNILMLMGVWIFSSLTLALVLDEVQAFGWSDSLAAVAFIPAYLLPFLLGTSLVLLWHRSQAGEKDGKNDSIGEAQLDNAVTFDAGPYIASAASVSSLLLVVLYFGVSQSISYSSHLNEIDKIRRAFVREAFVTYVRPVLNTADLQDVLNAKIRADTNGPWKDLSDTVRNISVSTPLGFAREKFVGIAPSDSSLHSVCVRAVVTEYQLPRPWESRACFQLQDLINAGPGAALPADPSTPQLAILALGHAVKLEQGESFEALYLRIENELLRKEVAFPSSGFSFPIEQAVWLSNIVAFLMLVMLHDRLGHVFADTNLGRGEPWLILDAKDQIAKGVAALWCIGLGIGPWALCVTTARMALLHIGVFLNGPATFLLQMLLIVALFLMTGPLSISVVAYILHLKRLRAKP